MTKRIDLGLPSANKVSTQQQDREIEQLKLELVKAKKDLLRTRNQRKILQGVNEELKKGLT